MRVMLYHKGCTTAEYEQWIFGINSFKVE